MGFFDFLKKADTAQPQPEANFVNTGGSLTQSNWQYRLNDGSKFPGGFGPTEILVEDYWTLRARSAELFEKNLYARGIVRRLCTNVINTGLSLEAMPINEITGQTDEAASDWSEDLEQRFTLWGEKPMACDYYNQRTFGQLQADLYMDSLINGDTLVTVVQSRRLGTPQIKLISGELVQTPYSLGATGMTPDGQRRIVQGVELDERDRHVAYWVLQQDNSFKRLPAVGPRSGRKLAWLVYGTEKRFHQVRGKPLLSLVLQSLKEIDRYRDSAQRKAVINSMLALFIQKDEERMGTMPMGNQAVRRDTLITNTTTNDEPRKYNFAEFIPGAILDELQVGEKPVAFGNNGTDEKFGDFEEAMIQAVAWTHNVPPEIMRLAFSNNYSASQAAINEFKVFLNQARTDYAASFCVHVFEDWFTNAVLRGQIQAPGYLEARRDMANQFDVYAAWLHADWSGQVKPSTDPVKLMNSYKMQLEEGVITRARVAREMGNGKFSQIVKQRVREDELLREIQPEPEAVDIGADGDTMELELVEESSEEQTA